MTRREIGAAIFGCVAALLIAEVVLRVVGPKGPVTVGWTGSPNAARYGWGYAPFEELRMLDPDTAEPIADAVNSQGWRDREHSLAKPAGTKRVLLIGDSVTFGTVRRADTIPERLQQLFDADGAHVEVMNLAYGGFSTDQELEALRAEGIAYAPDVVVYQFCTNDLDANLVTDIVGGLHKPFAYGLDASGALVRQEAAPTPAPADRGLRSFLASNVALVRWGLFLRRLWGLRSQVGPAHYRIDDGRIAHVRVVFGLPEDAPLLAALRLHAGSIDEAGIRAIGAGAGLSAADQAKLVRLLEDRWFQVYFGDPGRYEHRAPADPASPQWRVMAGLVGEIARTAKGAGAACAVFDETDLGNWEWEVEWLRVRDTPENRAAFLSQQKVLADVARAAGCGFIENRRVYRRYRNDPHPTPEGNAAMAADIHDWLVSYFAEQAAG